MCFLCAAKPSAARHSPWQARRAFLAIGGALATETALAQVNVGNSSELRKLVPAEELETSATQQYAQMMQEAKSK
ncbi:MAG: M48 family peptidase, partial [Rubrivivax sp.]